MTLTELQELEERTKKSRDLMRLHDHMVDALKRLETATAVRVVLRRAEHTVAYAVEVTNERGDLVNVCWLRDHPDLPASFLQKLTETLEARRDQLEKEYADV